MPAQVLQAKLIAALALPHTLCSPSGVPQQCVPAAAVGDYDGDVSQIDLETGHMVAEADGHAGRR